MITFPLNWEGGLSNILLDPSSGNKYVRGIDLGTENADSFAASRFEFHDISLYNTQYGGIRFLSVIWQLNMYNIEVFNAQCGIGVEFNTNDCTANQMIISGCYKGFYSRGSANKISNVKIDYCGNNIKTNPLNVTNENGDGYGAYFQLCAICQFVNWEAQYCYTHGYVMRGITCCQFTNMNANGNGSNPRSMPTELEGIGIQFDLYRIVGSHLGISQCYGSSETTRYNLRAKEITNSIIEYVHDDRSAMNEDYMDEGSRSSFRRITSASELTADEIIDIYDRMVFMGLITTGSGSSSGDASDDGDPSADDTSVIGNAIIGKAVLGK